MQSQWVPSDAPQHLPPSRRLDQLGDDDCTVQLQGQAHRGHGESRSGLAGPPPLPRLTRPGTHQLRRLQSGSQRLKASCRPRFHLAAAISRHDCDPREVSLDRGWTAHLGSACRGECRAAGQEPPRVGHHRRGEAPVPPQALDILAMLTIAQDWRRRGVDGVTIHGWVYHLEDVGGL
jgi:hypothetical protein